MTINQSRGEDGKFALAKGAHRGLYSRPIPHRPRIEITIFFSVSFFLKTFRTCYESNIPPRRSFHNTVMYFRKYLSSKVLLENNTEGLCTKIL